MMINSVTEKDNEEFISTSDAANMLGISLRSVQYWVENGKLDAWKTAGGHRRIVRRSVEKLIAEQDSARTRSTSAQSKNIVVVEDEPELLEYYRIHIDSWQLPVNIKTAEDGFEGLMQIGRHNPVAIITDLMMPNMDGFSMIQAIHEKFKSTNTKIIVITVLSQNEIDERGGLPDDVVIFQKPIPLKDLRNIIRTCVDHKSEMSVA